MAPRPPISKSPHTTSSSLSRSFKTPHKANKAPTKALKRSSKHATLLSRLQKTAPSRSKITKRRRPSKKLSANLDDLADALPDADAGGISGGTGEAEKGKDRGEVGAKIKHKSLKSRPGAGKKKERLVAREMERFAKNIAIMGAGSKEKNGVDGVQKEQGTAAVTEGVDESTSKGSSSERWAAIRRFIRENMEQRSDAVAGEKEVRGE